jgi:uncharacterized protein (DUF488 family)
MKTIFTMGTQGRKDETFIALLKEHGVDAVIDVRLHNEGRWYKFASGKHIEQLVRANGIVYIHDTRFSPSADMLRTWRHDHIWPVYQAEYIRLIEARGMLALWRETATGFARPCLLCAEKSPERCHRRLLGDYIAAATNCSVVHL